MDKNKAILLVLATAVISGFSIFINKFGVEGIDASVFTFLKNIIVAIFLFSLLFIFKEFNQLKKLTQKQWTQLAGIGLIGGSVPFVLFFEGLKLTSAASGALVHKTLFIYATIFAFLLLKEKLNKKIVLASILLLAGNTLLLKIETIQFGMGELLVLGAALLWALENVISKHALKELSGNMVAFGRMFFGSLFILAYLAFVQKTSLLMELTIADVQWVIITSILLLLYVTTYYNGLKHISVSVATSILLIGSPITTMLSFLFLGTPMAFTQFAGILLILAGAGIAVYLVELSEKRNPALSLA